MRGDVVWCTRTFGLVGAFVGAFVETIVRAFVGACDTQFILALFSGRWPVEYTGYSGVSFG